MSDRVVVAPEVLARLPADQLSRVYDHREHSDLRCIECGGWIAPESEDAVAVVLFEDVGRQGRLINFAHATCRGSAVVRAPLPPMPSPLGTSWVPVMRRHAIAATLLWEPQSTVRFYPDADDPVDPVAQGLRKNGFRLASDRLEALIAPLARGWSMRLRGSDLLLARPDRERADDEFNNALEVLPAGWLDAARRSRRVLVVYGSDLGLDRPLIPRIDQALQSGGALAGLVQWQSPKLGAGRRLG